MDARRLLFPCFVWLEYCPDAIHGSSPTPSNILIKTRPDSTQRNSIPPPTYHIPCSSQHRLQNQLIPRNSPIVHIAVRSLLDPIGVHARRRLIRAVHWVSAILVVYVFEVEGVEVSRKVSGFVRLCCDLG